MTSKLTHLAHSFNSSLRALVFWRLVAALSLGASACSTPVANEGLGSNTNWFAQCDQDADCGQALSCLCGACSRLCTGDSDCSDLKNGTCPVSLDSFSARCLDGQTPPKSRVCLSACEDDSDCAPQMICDAGYCAKGVGCDLVTSLTLTSSVETPRARKGALFASDFYLPTLFADEPASYEEPVTQAVFKALALNADGDPVEGCDVAFGASDEDGVGYADNSTTDEAGTVSALWVSGSADSQTLTAHVIARDATLAASVSGEARAHDAPPTSSAAAAVSLTQPSSIVVEPHSETAPQDISAVSLEFTPHTFPAQVAYVVLETDSFSLAYWNRSDAPADALSLGAQERTFEVRASTTQGPAEVIYPKITCPTSDGRLTCTFTDAWTLGEPAELRLTGARVPFGEFPSQYQAATHSLAPCARESGCSDLSVELIRPKASPQLISILRVSKQALFLNQRLFISHEEGGTAGLRTSCLLTDRAEMTVLYRSAAESIASEFNPATGASTFGSYISSENETCANYQADFSDAGFTLMTGGAVQGSTPNLPGQPREIPAP